MEKHAVDRVSWGDSFGDTVKDMDMDKVHVRTYKYSAYGWTRIETAANDRTDARLPVRPRQ
jgi:hypothetical protein